MRREAVTLAFAAALLLPASALAQHTLHMLEDNGPSSNRIDLLVMGDGYDSTEQGDLLADMTAAVDSIFEEWPFDEYTPFFNVAAIATVSAESGADHPGEGISVDSFYDCAYDCMGLDRLICCDDSTVFTVASEQYPAFDVILLVVNDSEYGGSGGAIAVVSTSPQATYIPPHEFGHTFAGLGDEYDDPYPGYTCTDIFPNVSFTADRDELKWSHWVLDETPLPTPETEALTHLDPVGAFEGACYQTSGIYRPVYECAMRALGNGMCPVCTEAIVLSFYGYVEPIDAFAPSETSLEGAAGDTLSFLVEPVRPDPDTVDVLWTVDGTPAGYDDGDSLDLPVSCVEQGEHEIAATVVDETAMVLDDPEDLLTQSVSWIVTRTDDGPVDECGGDTDADSDPDSDSDTADPLLLTPAGSSGSSGCGCSAVAGRSSVLVAALATFLR